jgi:hypothetical protein
MAEGMAFDQMAPKASVTDPLGHGLQTEYPKHLHQAGVSDDGGPRYVVVQSAPEEAEAIAAGWRLERSAALTEPAAPPPPPTRKR